MIIRTLKESELESAQKIWETCFDDQPSFVEWYFKNRIKPNEVLGYFKNPSSDSLVADLHMAPYQIRLRNIVFSSAYIIALATKPTERNKGIAKKLLKFSLKYLAEKGRLITILMPFNVQFYTRLGWGIIARHRKIAFKCTHANNNQNPSTTSFASSKKATGHIKVYKEAPPETGKLDRIYGKWVEYFCGVLLRNRPDWEGLLFDHYLDNGETRLFLNSHGEPEAYALTIRSENRLIIREIAYTILHAGKELLKNIFSQAREDLTWTAPLGDPLINCYVNGEKPFPTAQRNFHEIAVGTTPFMLGRITDIMGFIKLLPCPDQAFDLHVEIYDPLLPGNCGVFQLRPTENGPFKIARLTKKQPDVRCEIGIFTSLLSGDINSFHEFLTICKTSPELLWVRKEEYLLSLLKIFPPVVNYMNDYF